jgi:hypothetical protein
LVSLSIGAICAIGTGVWWRRSPHQQSLAISILLLVNALFNPYTPIYDLVLLLVAGVLAVQFYLQEVNSCSEQRALSTVYAILVIGCFGPHLSQSMASVLGVQLLPLILLTMGLVHAASMWRVGRCNAGQSQLS